MASRAIEPVALFAGQARRLATLLAAGRRPDPRDPRLVRAVAAQAVAQVFFAPLLAEMRKLPFGRKFGSGGRAEEVFGEQLDLRIADRVAGAQFNRLTRLLVARLERRGVKGAGG